MVGSFDWCLWSPGLIFHTSNPDRGRAIELLGNRSDNARVDLNPLQTWMTVEPALRRQEPWVLLWRWRVSGGRMPGAAAMGRGADGLLRR